MKAFIPEIELQNYLEGALLKIKTDIELGVDGIFYSLLNAIDIEKLNYFQEAKDLFVKEYRSNEKIEIRRFFDRERAKMPTIHITLPKEQFGRIHGIGNDEGYFPLDDEETFEDTSGEKHPYFTKSFSCNFDLVFTGKNIEQALLIYNVIKLYIIGNFEVITELGFENLRIGGVDLQPNFEQAPIGYFRGLSFQFDYLISVPKILGDTIITDVEFTGIPKSE